MKNILLEKILDILSCPYCGNDLIRKANGYKCIACEEEYTDASKDQPDLRLIRGKAIQFQFEVGNKFLVEKHLNFSALQMNPSSKVKFSKKKIPHHISKELLSFFPKAKGTNSIVLDLGCGSTLHREVCEHAGFKYIGLDYDSPEACLLGDAHALPFKDNTFEFILSIAVLEHIQNPFIMLKEAHRVLKPGGKLIGTVSFLEPFHGNSFYHHTHLGTLNSLKTSGFEIENVAPNSDWYVLKAQAKMVLFPKLPASISSFLILPLHLLHRLWWKLGSFISNSDKASEKHRILYSTGSFSFIASK